MCSNVRNYGVAKMSRGLFKLKFSPEYLEQEYDNQRDLSVRDNFKQMIRISPITYGLFMILEFFVFGGVSYAPALVSLFFNIESLWAMIMLRRHPEYAYPFFYLTVTTTWVLSAVFARTHMALERAIASAYTYFATIRSSRPSTVAWAAGAVVFRLSFDYFGGLPFFWVWTTTLVLLFVWSVALTYFLEVSTRDLFLLTKKKDEETAELAAKQLSRTSYDLVHVKKTGKFKVVKRDLLTNEVVDGADLDDVDEMDESGGESADMADNSGSEVSSTTDSPIDSDGVLASREMWLRESIGSLKTLSSLALLVHVALSLSSWFVIPNEIRGKMFMYHANFLIPVAISSLTIIRTGTWVNTYKRYIVVLSIMQTISYVLSWLEAAFLCYYDENGILTASVIVRMFLLMYIRHSFYFIPKKMRIIVSVFDGVGYFIALFIGEFWLQRQTLHHIRLIIFMPILALGAGDRAWKQVLDIYTSLKRLEILNEEHRRETGAMKELRDLYMQREEDTRLVMKKVENVEHWTPPQSVFSETEWQAEFFEKMVGDIGLIERLNIELVSFRSTVITILQSYKLNPYHNSAHALSVCHVLKYFLMHGGAKRYFSDVEQLALMLAGLSHDFGHPGLNNAFLIKTSSPWVERYGASSTLEHHHFRGFMRSVRGLRFVPGIKDDEVLEATKLVKQAILATDTATFAQTLELFESEVPRMTQEMQEMQEKAEVPNTTKQALARMMMVCSDVGNVTFATPEAEMWLVSLVKEFYLQGDKELKLDMIVSMFMDRTKNAPYTLCCGFIDMVAGRMIRSLSSVLHIESFVNQMDNNRQVFGKIKVTEA